MKRTLDVIADPNTPTIVTRRWFAAPPELVWEAWTRPELLRQWMGPRTLECVSYDVDLRVGGGWRMVHRAPDGQEFGFHGEYREIERPHRLVGTFVFEPMPDHVAVDTLTLEAKDGGTLATTHTLHASLQARDGHLQSGMEAGMADGYLRLDALLAERWAGSPGVIPFLWFDGRAEEAIRYYLEVFGDGRIVSETRHGDRLFSATFEVRGLRLMALNGGPMYAFNEAISLFVPVDGQDEVDHLWSALIADGGSPGRCGWLKDRWGLSWQVVPRALFRLMGDPDPARARRATEAMMGMDKLDIAALEAAADGR